MEKDVAMLPMFPIRSKDDEKLIGKGFDSDRPISDASLADE